MIFSSWCDFLLGHGMGRIQDPRKRKGLLIASMTINLTALGFFKYYNFFADSLVTALGTLGIRADLATLEIVLPVGISFYTFQSMSYIIDIYRRDTEPIRNFLDFSLFVSYFPQLVAGPIERFHNLYPQISRPRSPSREMITEGAFLILWGMFKKILIADNLADIANHGFAHLDELNFFTAMATIYAFAFQIYCDFSGYTDIARGVSQLLGIKLMLNFNFPYFSTNPAEFWQRWHISLSTWLRDYLYIPLGGNRHGEGKTYRNLMTTMLLGGLWHGANWTFVAWGFYQGLLLVVFRLFGHLTAIRVPRWIGALLFFQLVCVGWVFFRAQSFEDCIRFFQALGNFGPSYMPRIHTLALVVPLLAMELLQFARKDSFFFFRFNPALRVAFYLGVYSVIMLLGRWESNSFIYFQF